MHKDVQKTVVTVYQTFILDASTVHIHTHTHTCLTLCTKLNLSRNTGKKKPTHLTRKKKSTHSQDTYIYSQYFLPTVIKKKKNYFLVSIITKTLHSNFTLVKETLLYTSNRQMIVNKSLLLTKFIAKIKWWLFIHHLLFHFHFIIFQTYWGTIYNIVPRLVWKIICPLVL